MLVCVANNTETSGLKSVVLKCRVTVIVIIDMGLANPPPRVIRCSPEFGPVAGVDSVIGLTFQS